MTSRQYTDMNLKKCLLNIVKIKYRPVQLLYNFVFRFYYSHLLFYEMHCGLVKKKPLI